MTKTSTISREEKRRKSIKLLKTGVCTPTEAASLAGESRQLIDIWLHDQKGNRTYFDWRSRRKARLRGLWRRA